MLDRLAEMTKRRMYFQSRVIGSNGKNCEEGSDYQPGTEDALIDEPTFPRLMFLENLYNGDPTNWWLPNGTALESLLRSSGLQVIACPHSEVIVAEPEVYLCKKKYRNLVFPRYGKRGRAFYPGPQRVDPKLWRELVSKAWSE